MDSTTNLLDTSEKLHHSILNLLKIEPLFKPIFEQFGTPPLRTNPQGFIALFSAILGQQITTTAAQKIRERLTRAGLNNATAIQAASDEELKEHGVSRQKIRYLKSLAEHNIDYKNLQYLSDKEVVETLTVITGVGRWTAEIYLLFSLHRPDICPHNDHALKVAAQEIFSLDHLPTEREMSKLAEKWSPYRSAASYLLWAYYRATRNRDAIIADTESNKTQ